MLDSTPFPVYASAIWRRFRLRSADFSSAVNAVWHCERKSLITLLVFFRFCVRSKGKIVSLNIITLRKFNSIHLDPSNGENSSSKKIFHGDTVAMEIFHVLFYATPAKWTFRLRQSTMWKPGRRGKLHYERIDTETQGDNFILIFWVNTRIINLDYEGELMLLFAAVRCHSSMLIPSEDESGKRCIELPYVALHERKLKQTHHIWVFVSCTSVMSKVMWNISFSISHPEKWFEGDVKSRGRQVCIIIFVFVRIFRICGEASSSKFVI